MLEKNINDEYDPSLDELDAMELGRCKELISDEIYMPCHKSRDWVRCYISMSNSDSFRMYLEGSKRRFLLSAKIFNPGIILISAYEEFPLLETRPKKGFLGRVEKQNDNSFLVQLNSCHLCDNKLGIFCCGRYPNDREVVAKISHSIRRINSKMPIDFRYMKVSIPKLSSESGMKKIWCPRSFRKSNISLSNTADINECINECPNMAIRYVNKLPDWNEKLNSLVLRFQGNRILTASSKNFFLYNEKYATNDLTVVKSVSTDDNNDDNNAMNSESNLDSQSSNLNKKDKRNGSRTNNNNNSNSNNNNDENANKMKQSSDSYDVSEKGVSTKNRKNTKKKDPTDCAILQFGKSTSNRYILDFKYPLSPIQAFGIALSSFAFQDNYEKNYNTNGKNFSPF